MATTEMMKPQIDPEMLPAMAMIPSSDLSSLEVIQATRKMIKMGDEAAMTAVKQAGEVEIEERTCEGVGGNVVELLVLKSKRGEGKKACVYNVHGGGMIMGSRYMFVAGLVEMVKEFDVVVVSVEYRLAPEAKAPAQVEDAYSGLKHVSDQAADFGIDADRIVIFGGSAGAGIAAGVALMARDRNGPKLLAQCLLYPMLDDRNESVSVKQFWDVGTWTGAKNHVCWDHMVPNLGSGDLSIYVAPSRATDLSGLPRTYIEVGSAEPFREEDVAYATKLWECGVDAELHVWPGAIHGYDAFAPTAKISQAARSARVIWLKRVFAEAEAGLKIVASL